jgi:hypothetical protein
VGSRDHPTAAYASPTPAQPEATRNGPCQRAPPRPSEERRARRTDSWPTCRITPPFALPPPLTVSFVHLPFRQQLLSSFKEHDVRPSHQRRKAQNGAPCGADQADPGPPQGPWGCLGRLAGPSTLSTSAPRVRL